MGAVRRADSARAERLSMPSEAVTFRLPVLVARGLLRVSLGFFFLSKLCTRAGSRLLLFTLTVAPDIGAKS